MMKGKGGKGAALAILAAMPKKESEGDEIEGSEAEGSESEAAAGEALADAIKSRDGAAIAAAFKDLMDTCGY